MSKQPSMWEFSKSITPGQGAGRKVNKAGWAVTRFVYGTVFCVILLWLLFRIAVP